MLGIVIYLLFLLLWWQTQEKSLCMLPQALTLNCQVESDKDVKFWQVQQRRDKSPQGGGNHSLSRWVPLSLKLKICPDGSLDVSQDHQDYGRSQDSGRSQDGEQEGGEFKEGGKSQDSRRSQDGEQEGGKSKEGGKSQDSGISQDSRRSEEDSKSEDSRSSQNDEQEGGKSKEDGKSQDSRLSQESGNSQDSGGSRDDGRSSSCGGSQDSSESLAGGKMGMAQLAEPELALGNGSAGDAATLLAPGAAAPSSSLDQVEGGGRGGGEGVEDEEGVAGAADVGMGGESGDTPPEKGEGWAGVEDCGTVNEGGEAGEVEVKEEEEESEENFLPDEGQKKAEESVATVEGCDEKENGGRQKGGAKGACLEAEYELAMVVCHVRESWMECHGNLVAHIKVGPSYHLRKEVSTIKIMTFGNSQLQSSHC